jgi:hypothetical protein
VREPPTQAATESGTSLTSLARAGMCTLPMTAVSLFVFSATLIALGIASYLLTGRKSVTALIPAFAGLLVGLFASLALLSSGWVHSMSWAAAGLALLGALATARGLQACIAALVKRRALGAAAISKALMCLVCIGFVSLAAVQGI